MSATADFLLEVEEARDYLKCEFPKAQITIVNNGVLVKVHGIGEYIIKPIPRDDYKDSRRMKGWEVIRVVDREEHPKELVMVASYEQATTQLKVVLGDKQSYFRSS